MKKLSTMFCRGTLTSSQKMLTYKNWICTFKSFRRVPLMACQRRNNYTFFLRNNRIDKHNFFECRHSLKVLHRFIVTTAIQRSTEVDRTGLSDQPEILGDLKSTDSSGHSNKDSSPSGTEVQINSDQVHETAREVQKLFPNPKNALHNIFSLIAQETKNKSFSLSPSFRPITENKKLMWLCTYNIGWPKEMKFMAKDTRKKVASDKAALEVLSWLLKERKITRQGAPVIYDEKELKNISKSTVPTISLDGRIVDNMRKIVDLYQNEMVPHILGSTTSVNDNKQEDESEIMFEEDGDLKTVVNQRYLGLDRYLAREKVDLPIAAYKEKIMDLLNSHQVLIIKGEPGCGKSTRVPQYVLEAWAEDDGLLGKPGKIAVTQPRRIAAISLAQRVAAERDESVGHIVGYQVRLNSNFRPNTGRILYCTTGILLRHLQSNSDLSNFTHVILDEAHERDVNTDLLMNLSRSAMRHNPNLKLIVMSATIDTNMFSEYFDGAPVLEIPGFTHPVKEHFLDTCEGFEANKTLKMCEGEVPAVVHEDVAKMVQYIHHTRPEGAILCFLPGWEDISKVRNLIPRQPDVFVYCLHSRLQDSEQWKIFSRPPPGVRKVILSTNIAETSVTVDDVVYVIDTGIQKEQRFDVAKGIKCIDNHWISKASVTQRKGRAGRVQPGESFHLYTTTKHKSFPDYSLPEIMRTSLTKIVLDSKVFSNNMNALQFMRELPASPEEDAIAGAVDQLKDLELLDKEENLTTLGRTVADFQLEPELGKAMVNAVVFKCVTPIVDIVTLFSAETELFVSGLLDKEEARAIKTSFCGDSDHLAMMRLFEKFLEVVDSGGEEQVARFCDSVSLVAHKMRTLEKLRKIHFDYLYNGLHEVLPVADDYSDNDEMVKAVLFSGVGNILTFRNWDIVKKRLKNNANILLTRNNHKATITPESVNYRRKKYPSNYLLYINETRSNVRRTTLVRESSILSDLSVFLFSNRNLKVLKIGKHETGSTEPDDDKVELVLEGTNIKCLCDKFLADEIVECREAILSSYRYFITQLTQLGESNEEAISSWNSILVLLNEILKRRAND